MNQNPQVKLMGKGAVLIEFKPEINPDLLDRLVFLRNYLQDELLEQKVEVINTYSSLLINYNSTIEDPYSEIQRVGLLIRSAPPQSSVQKWIFQLPVCYDQSFAIDMEELSERNGLTEGKIIDLHTASLYTVYFIGFLPGFLYMGGLHEKLAIPRKAQPRQRIKKGAVGIGGDQTGIYPMASPGGWQIIGNSPVPLFNGDRLPPCEIAPGDKVKFYSISLAEHREISKEVSRGAYQFQKVAYEGDD